VGSSQAATTLGVFGLCVAEERLLAKSVKIVEVEEFFHSFDRTVLPDNENRLIILMRTEDQAAPLMDCMLVFLHDKEARYMLFDTGALAMEGVDPDVRYLLLPFVAEACLKSIVNPVAEKRSIKLN
jgi:fructoselysine 6-phosphate deglycase